MGIMAAKAPQTERTESSVFANGPSDLGALGKKQIDELLNLQTEFLGKLHEANRRWFDRARLEANLASEFASNLTAARSVPDAVSACQGWSRRQFEIVAEDGKQFIDDAQKLAATGARFFSNGWPNGNSGLST
jgi:hypothetical protein